LFCSGGYDGKVNVYSALRMELLMCFQITTMAPSKNVNAVKFSSDGSRILAATTARSVTVVDVERGEQVSAYDNCVYSGRDRTGLAAHPICPFMAVCVAVNGKGISLIDFRMPLPLDFIYDGQRGIVRDIVFAGPGWPWGRGLMCTIILGTTDGFVKVCSVDGRLLHNFHAGHSVNTVAVTPEPFSKPQNALGFHSMVVCGGEKVSGYVPEVGIQEVLKEHKNESVCKLKYTSTGSLLYSVGKGGVLRRYRRYPNYHEYLGEVFRHTSDIQDMDISSFDEYLITASKDGKVGLLRLGSPTHGYTAYCELT